MGISAYKEITESVNQSVNSGTKTLGLSTEV
jgi:hypothetical protein